jgi:hypothetical protein
MFKTTDFSHDIRPACWQPLPIYQASDSLWFSDTASDPTKGGSVGRQTPMLPQSPFQAPEASSSSKSKIKNQKSSFINQSLFIHQSPPLRPSINPQLANHRSTIDDIRRLIFDLEETAPHHPADSPHPVRSSGLFTPIAPTPFATCV